MNFIHRPEFQMTRKRFRNWIFSPSSSDGSETYSVGSLQKADLSDWPIDEG
jgi:hypothetical protein